MDSTLISLISLILTPILTLGTLWLKQRFERRQLEKQLQAETLSDQVEVTATVTTAKIDDASKLRAELWEEIKNLREEIRALHVENSGYQEKIQELATEKVELNARIDEQQRIITDSQEDFKELKRQISQLILDRDKAFRWQEEEIARLRTEVGRLMHEKNTLQRENAALHYRIEILERNSHVD